MTRYLARIAGPNGGGQEIALKPGAYKRIEALASEGHALGSIARSLGMSRRAFQEVRKRDPEAQDAFETGKAVDEALVANVLRAKALSGDTVAMLFWLKTRHGYREGDPAQASGPSVQINLALPSPKSQEEYMRTITGQAEEVTK